MFQSNILFSFVLVVLLSCLFCAKHQWNKKSQFYSVLFDVNNRYVHVWCRKISFYLVKTLIMSYLFISMFRYLDFCGRSQQLRDNGSRLYPVLGVPLNFIPLYTLIPYSFMMPSFIYLFCFIMLSSFIYPVSLKIW
jgi:hypothetical protein